MTPQSATLMGQYNRWMNERMFEAATKLEAAELVADKGAFFGSILGTLNHIAVGDTIWLHRFAQHPAGFISLAALSDLPRPTSLDQALASSFESLRTYRQKLDALILSWATELTPEHLSSNLSYANMAGVLSVKSFASLVQHFFNNQTHHRGQVSALLFQSGVDIGVTDLLSVIPNNDV